MCLMPDALLGFGTRILTHARSKLSGAIAVGKTMTELAT